mmetsp:Transcript_52461/g.72749  ORF Transcript_52461/g.72749 Transcript_52461/m.72749 type:complete len:110 (+) Transcript_52461:37-366(+)
MEGSSASKSISYAYDDWAIYQIANFMGIVDIAEDFKDRSTWYKYSFDPKSKFFCPVDTKGTFNCPKGIGKLNVFDNRYTEGDSWHYRFFTPGDPEGLIELFGGNKIFAK